MQIEPIQGVKMSNAKVKFSIPFSEGDGVIIDGHELKCVSSITTAVSCNEIPHIYLDLAILNLEVDVDGVVSINTCEIPNSVAFAIYEKLKLKFD